MAKIEIQGKWIGNYSYGHGYPEEIRKKIFPFLLEIWSDGDIIRGTSTDDITKEFFNQPAKIEGTFENDEIAFLLTYPCLVLLDKENKIFIEKDKPSLGILYTGILKKGFILSGLSFKGEWDISKSFIDENKIARYSTYMGYWEMKRLK